MKGEKEQKRRLGTQKHGGEKGERWVSWQEVEGKQQRGVSTCIPDGLHEIGPVIISIRHSIWSLPCPLSVLFLVITLLSCYHLRWSGRRRKRGEQEQGEEGEVLHHPPQRRAPTERRLQVPRDPLGRAVQGRRWPAREQCPAQCPQCKTCLLQQTVGKVGDLGPRVPATLA